MAGADADLTRIPLPPRKPAPYASQHRNSDSRFGLIDLHQPSQNFRSAPELSQHSGNARKLGMPPFPGSLTAGRKRLLLPFAHLIRLRARSASTIDKDPPIQT